MELDELRAEIDEVDWELVQLLNRRAKLSLRVGQAKRQSPAGPASAVDVYQPSREATVLEQVARSFPGVEHAYAIQAGREIRVIANASQTSDADAIKVCHDIARAIEEQLNYPGEIKVTVVRETRSVEIAH